MSSKERERRQMHRLSRDLYGHGSSQAQAVRCMSSFFNPCASRTVIGPKPAMISPTLFLLRLRFLHGAETCLGKIWMI
jgi:hypothetical protein